MKYYRGQFREEWAIPKQHVLECHVVCYLEDLGWDFMGSKVLCLFTLL